MKYPHHRRKTMPFDEFEDFFDLRFGPFQMAGFARPFKVAYSRTSDSHVVRLTLRRDVQRKDIKVRLLEGGVLEIEWPRRLKGEDIPVE
jgi:hypothetical protein